MEKPMTRIKSLLRRRFSLALAALAAGLSAGLAQVPGGFNERDVKKELNVEDKDGIWVLDFQFKDPRLITVDIPGRGRRLCWYLWYRVSNKTGLPRTFIPDFELVTYDPPGTYHDQVLPKVQEAIRQVEDPTKQLDIKNSVTIASEPIPASKPDGFPKAVTGVAIWDDVKPEANQYSIFVSGLSNGWSLAEIPPNNQQVIRRKTLQLNFKRLGDKFSQDARDIRFMGPAQWLYRGATKAPELKKAEEPAPKVGGARPPLQEPLTARPSPSER
jgi:hypothetical protein